MYDLHKRKRNDSMASILDDEDFCRVRLKTDSEEALDQSSDYINASIVRCIRPV